MNFNATNDKELIAKPTHLSDKKHVKFFLKWALVLIGFCGAIGIPIAITLPIIQKKENTIPHNSNEIEAITVLNSANNVDTRINVWNEYITHLSNPITPNGNDSMLNKIVREDIFINQFIDFLTTNLLIDNSSSPENGSITQHNLDLIRAELNKDSTKDIFKNSNLSVYTNLFKFSQNSSIAMFSFDNVSIPLISFSLFMPFSISGLDLIYRDDKSVDIKIDNTSNIINNKVRLTINKFPNPSITTPINYYFKSLIPIEFPPIITNGFPDFFSGIVNTEVKAREKLINGLITIKNSIDSDATSQIGLSYWNDFTAKYGTFNKPFVERDLQKTIETSSLYNFISTNVHPDLNLRGDLNAIRSIAANPLNLGLNNTPYNNSSRMLFNTSNTSGTKYALTINIFSFRYEFTVNNLFSGIDNAIKITPYLMISGVLRSISPGVTSDTYITSGGASAQFNMQNTIDMSYLNGLVGFFYNLILAPITN